MRRIVEVKKSLGTRFGSSGYGHFDSLIGIPYDSVVRLDPSTKKFTPSNAYPDLDISTVGTEPDTSKDNRNLVDNNRSQQLSNTEVRAIREEGGVEALLDQLVENSATFDTKTPYAQEKYLRRKMKKHDTLFKVEKVTVDLMAEVHIPTIQPSDQDPEESKSLRLRMDTVALILHHSEVHASSRVLVFERTNGLLPSYLMTRLGPDGLLFQGMEKNSQPNLFHTKVLQLTNVKERWKAVPLNEGFLLGKETVEQEKEAPQPEPSPSHAVKEQDEPKNKRKRTRGGDDDDSAPRGVSQWLKGYEAYKLLTAQAADSLVIADDVTAFPMLKVLFPFLAYGGHIVIYTPYLEDLSAIFQWLRPECVNIRVSETWCRHMQVLSQRTHPTVNMSTAGGYLLTAIKINPENRPMFSREA